MEQISKIFFDLLQIPVVRAGFILAGSMAAALLVRLVFTRLILSWSKKTKTGVDNQLADVFHGPVVYSIILAGIALVIVDLNFKPTVNFIATGIVKTFAVIIWGRAAMQTGTILLEILSRQVDRVSWIQPKTLPLFEIVLKVVVIGGSLYFAFIAWHINVTSWIASAGIMGIAVGFAAKDTLANLFAGVFILADTPYKIGDFIILEERIRGVVTDIGIRSTRLLTRDDVEVTVPNAVIANSMIINESGGPYQKTRLRVKTSVAYGSDVDKVSELMNSCVKDVDHISVHPEPRVRFREFGDFGLLFELLVWVDKPLYKGSVLHRLNTLIYKKFNEEGIEIPYPKQDVYIKQMPEMTRTFSRSEP
ncbi:MAG: mechanosensitive ion channel family protein [Sedimentisphaerales bacterium]|nr:mechanosensitive ion channel family protein [Sedimentisphaerales bacterium]